MNPLHDLGHFAPEYREDIGDKIPEHLRDGLARYLLDGIKPGSFMRHVIANDLYHAAIAAGDAVSLQDLRSLALLLIWCAPDEAHGNPEALESWGRKGGYRGMAGRRKAV